MTSRPHWGRRAAVASGVPREGPRAAPLATRVARALAAHEHLTAAGLLALLVLAYLWPVLVGGRTLAPTALLFEYAPWRTSAPAGAAHFVNGDLADVPGTYYPWTVLARRLLHGGTFPAWNPFAFAGTQLFANSQLAWFSPFSLPLWILPLNYAFGVAAALKLWTAGFGTYLLVRELRLGFWPALLAGVSFALCAFNVVWLTYGVFVSVAALLPWALWLVERIVRRRRSVDALALVAVVAVFQTGGHPGTQLHVVLAIALYALIRALATAGLDRRQRLRALGLTGAAVALGTLILAVVLVPAQQAAVDTFGALVRRDGAPGLPGSHVHASALRTALFPEWWGRPSEHVGGEGASFRERTFYAGVVPLVLAAIALVSPGAWRRKAPFALLAALGVAVPLRAPLIYPLLMAVPPFDSVQNQRMLLLFVFAVAVLAAFGLRAALDAPRAPRTWAVVGTAVLAAPLAALSVPDAGAAAGDVARQLWRRADHEVDAVSAGTLALASVAWWLIFVLALAAILLLARSRVRWRVPLGALAALVVALDLLHFAHGFNPMGPATVVIPPRTAAVDFLEAHAGDRRIAGINTAFMADWSTVYGLADVRGRDAPQPSMRFARLWGALDAFEVAKIRSFTLQGLNVLGLLGARLLVTDPDLDLTARDVTIAYSGEDAAIFRNARAVPRAFVPTDIRVARDEAGERAAVFARSFDPRRDAVVRRDEIGADVPQRGAGVVRVVDEENARVRLRAQLRRPSLVVLDDQWTPGWSVRVDDEPARVVRTDVVLRGVRVPAGSHEVEWSYRVPGLRLGATLSGAGLLIALAWGGAVWSRRRRTRRRAAPA
jgi:hypothetical protein